MPLSMGLALVRRTLRPRLRSCGAGSFAIDRCWHPDSGICGRYSGARRVPWSERYCIFIQYLSAASTGQCRQGEHDWVVTKKKRPPGRFLFPLGGPFIAHTKGDLAPRFSIDQKDGIVLPNDDLIERLRCSRFFFGCEFEQKLCRTHSAFSEPNLIPKCHGALRSCIERAFLASPSLDALRARPHRFLPHRCDVKLDGCLIRRLIGKVKRPCDFSQGLVLLGSPTWARTRDLRINSPALYRLSYRGTAKK